MNQLIKNESLIQEDSKVEDLFDFSKLKVSLTKKIDKINNNSFIGVIGGFGVGKSTLLYQIEKENTDKLWVNFDSWKYPDRSNLWEGFILDLAEQLGEQKKVLKAIEGKSTGKEKVDILTDIVGALSKVPGVNVVDKVFQHLFDKSPAKRVFELQQLLEKLIIKQDSEVIIVVEDIDRSGDAGIYFIETLKQFFKSISSKKVVVLIPIADSNYHKHNESYIKSLDYIFFFRPENIGFQNFIEETINLKFYEKNKIVNMYTRQEIASKLVKDQLDSFFKALFEHHSQLTIRSLKLILRNADVTYRNMIEDGNRPDIRVTICMEAMKYISPRNKEGEYQQTYISRAKINKNIESGNVFSALLSCIALDEPNLYQDIEEKNLKSTNIKLIDTVYGYQTENPVLMPWYLRNPFREETGIYLNNRYLEY
jgi:hypothetical protein